MALPKIADKKPTALELEPGKYFWCACGESKKQPFCDGSHRTTEFTPISFDIIEKKTYYLCQCKQSGRKPFCDGTHNKL